MKNSTYFKLLLTLTALSAHAEPFIQNPGTASFESAQKTELACAQEQIRAQFKTSAAISVTGDSSLTLDPKLKRTLMSVISEGSVYEFVARDSHGRAYRGTVEVTMEEEVINEKTHRNERIRDCSCHVTTIPRQKSIPCFRIYRDESADEPVTAPTVKDSRKSTQSSNKKIDITAGATDGTSTSESSGATQPK